MSDSTILIETNSGPVRGVKRTSILGDDYLSFQRIPYAEPPIGARRFRDPVPVKPWKEPIDGRVQGPPCWAFDKILQKTVGDEDCLHLNVFTNDAYRSTNGSVYMKRKKLRPVMVYLHGGAFMWGSSGVDMYGPDYLIQKDIVFVSLNYRLGAFGFLCIDNPKLGIPGNAGLKDQVLALKWIKANIQHFGGDPNNITLFGESAGGCAVHYMMMTDLAKDLFHKAIVMSGCALNNWSILTVKDIYKRLASRLGWNEADGDEKALEVLQNADPADIAKLQMSLMTSDEIKVHHLFSFGPVIEPFVTEQCLIPKSPLEMNRAAWSKNIPLLIGGTSEDGLYLYRQTVDNPRSMDFLNNNPEYLVPGELGHALNSDKCRELGLKIKKFYFGDAVATMEMLPKYIDLVSDKWFWHGLHRTILSRLGNEVAAPTFVYRFNFDSETFNHYKIRVCGKGVRGSCHADDLSYLFKNIFVESIQLDSPEWLTISRMIGIWTQFAETSNPNDALVEPIVWKSLKSTEEYMCLNISNDLSYIELPEKKRMAFWDSLYTENQLF